MSRRIASYGSRDAAKRARAALADGDLAYARELFYMAARLTDDEDLRQAHLSQAEHCAEQLRGGGA